MSAFRGIKIDLHALGEFLPAGQPYVPPLPPPPGRPVFHATTTMTRQNTALNGVLASINNTGGPTAGTLKIYSGSAPSSISSSATGTLLSTCTFVNPSSAAFGSASTSGTNSVATAQTSGGYAAQDTSLAASGTAGYFRILDSTGAAVLQGTVGTSGSDLNLNTVSLTSGGTLTITSFTVTASGWGS